MSLSFSLLSSQTRPNLPPFPLPSNSNRHFLLPHRTSTTSACPSSPIRRRLLLEPNSTFLSLRCSSSMSVENSTPTSQLQDSLFFSRAYWVSKSIIAWNVDVGDGSCFLFASKTAALSIVDDGVEGKDMQIKLEEDSCGLPENVIRKFPHIQDYRAFKVPSTLDAKTLLKCQLAVATFNCITYTQWVLNP